ncbi:MAG: hypothetical protein ABI852_13865 [Gemmatimonadaceae bacterium]
MMMKTTFVKSVRTIVFASFAVGMQACGCDGVACIDGLIVTMTSLPAAPFKVELLVAGQVQSAPEEATCSVGASRPCEKSMLFRTLQRDQVSIRVTTSSGVRTTDLPRINYKSSSSGCSDCKGQAEVTANIP